MTSNVPWNNQFETNYSNASENSTAWNRPLVNTPQTNPASWPQLGSNSAETEQSTAKTQAQEETNWNSSSMNNSTTNIETTTSAWALLTSDSNTKSKTPSATGWGAPATGPAWGQTTVDNGTAVWGKTGTSQVSWSSQGQVSQSNEATPSTSGWGLPSAIPSNTTESDAQQAVPSSGSSTNTNQPISWAKAASAGLSTTNNVSDTTPPVTEQDSADSTSTPVSTSAPSVETDPVQKLVNSHEGWGKKPIQQSTSWNISDPGTGFSRSQVSNGTEAWGKHGNTGQMPPGPGWGDGGNSKPGTNWGNTSTYQSNQGWAAQSQGRSNYVSGNGPASASWGDQQQPAQSGVNNGRWNDIPPQMQTPNTNWGPAPPLSQQPVTPNWSATPGGSNSNSWGAVTAASASQGSSWGGNMSQQASSLDQSSWSRSAETGRGVDNGTSAWGDPGTYTKVNMWDKRGKPSVGNEAVAGQMPPVNSQIKTTGWGVPNQPTNRAPSPKGWGDVSPTCNNPVDNGTAGWGKPLGGEKWDKGNSGNNWNSVKPTGGGWGQPPDHQWGVDSGTTTWGQVCLVLFIFFHS